MKKIIFVSIVFGMIIIVASQYTFDWSVAKHGLTINADNVTVNNAHVLVIGNNNYGISVANSYNSVVNNGYVQLKEFHIIYRPILITGNYTPALKIVEHNADGSDTLRNYNPLVTTTVNGSASIQWVYYK